jgi:hypothetical protein
MKSGIRILGVDDSPFEKKDRSIRVVGVVWRDGTIEGILSSEVRRDGRDATQKLLKMIKNSRFFPQIKVIMMNSIMMGGFNVVDIKGLSSKLGIPVIALTKREPNMKDVRNALEKFKDFRLRWNLVVKAGPSEAFKAKGKEREGNVWAQLAGISKMDSGEVLYKAGIEPVRLAHIIATGIARGESHGRV